MKRTKVGIVIATKDRPILVGETVDRLKRQSAPASCIVVVGTSPTDLPSFGVNISAVVSQTAGASAQRNAGTDALPQDIDIVLFLDDDVELAHDYIERLCEVFEDSSVVGASGLVVLDGAALSQSISREEASDALSIVPEATPVVENRETLYGCNMAARLSIARRTKFDERLPAYSWLEDRDFAVRVAREGRIVQANQARMVHLGFQGGRTPGIRLGYSQIVNPWYLWRKGTLAWHQTLWFWRRALIGNAMGLLLKDSKIDRSGRLRGNMLGILAVVLKRGNPEALPGI